MQASNVGIVFGPTVMRSETDTLEMATLMPVQNGIMEWMITDFEKMFKKWSESSYLILHVVSYRAVLFCKTFYWISFMITPKQYSLLQTVNWNTAHFKQANDCISIGTHQLFTLPYCKLLVVFVAHSHLDDCCFHCHFLYTHQDFLLKYNLCTQ